MQTTRTLYYTEAQAPRYGNARVYIDGECVELIYGPSSDGRGEYIGVSGHDGEYVRLVPEVVAPPHRLTAVS